MATIAGTILDNAGAVYNVKNSDFSGGAKGDGSTDDYDAIAAAITVATAVGGVVYFPPGIYMIRQKLDGVPGRRNVLVGANRDSCIIKRQPGSGGVIDWQTVAFNHLTAEFSCRIEELTLDGSSNTGVVLDIANLTLASVRRVNITGNGLTGPAANCIGLRLTSMFDSHFEDIYVTSCGGTGANGPCVLLDAWPTLDQQGRARTLNNCQFYNLHIEPGPVQATLLQAYGNNVNEIGDNFFYGLKTHGDPASGAPNAPLVKMSQYTRANIFYGHIVAFGNSHSTGQVECDGQRNVWYSPDSGINATDTINKSKAPANAFKFLSHAVNNVVWCPNIKTPSGYYQAPFRCEPSSLHNKIFFPQGSGFVPTNPLSDAGRNLIWWDDIQGTTLTLRNADGTTFAT